MRELHIGEAHLLGGEHVLGVEAGEPELADALLGGHDVVDTVEEPLVDLGGIEDLLNGPAAAQGLGHVEDALGRRGGDLLGEALLFEVVLAVRAESGVPLLEGAHGLLHGLLEGGADGHDLADGLHTGREAVGSALELLEREARDLDHAVVDRRLEAGGRGVRDVVLDLVQGIAHGKKRRHLRDGEAGGLGGERRGAGDARVHLDDDDAAVLGVHGELDVGTAAGDADALEDGDGVVAQALELVVVQGLARRHGDGVAGVDAHGVEVLDGADDDAVAGHVAHDLHLDLFPALDGLLDQDLGLGRERQALLANAQQVIVVIGDAAARAAEGEGRADDHGIAADGVDRGLALLHGVGDLGLGDVDADVLHGGREELAVLARLDGVDVAADDLDAVLVEHTCVRERHGAVEAGLAAHVGKKRVGTLLLDDLGHGVGRDRLDIGAVGGLGIGHDGGRVGVDEDDLVALLAQRLAGLGAGVVELAGLADDDGAGTDDEDLLDVGALGH